MDKGNFPKRKNKNWLFPMRVWWSKIETLLRYPVVSE